MSSYDSRKKIMKNGKWVKYHELAARGEGTESTLKSFVEVGVGDRVLETLDGRMSLFYRFLCNLPLSYQGVWCDVIVKKN